MNRREKRFTENIMQDFFDNYFVDKVYSKEEEIKEIKKLKLSFYYEVDNHHQELYLNYYKQMYPTFALKYDMSNDEEKRLLLEEAIEDAIKNRDEFMNHNYKLVLFVFKKMKIQYKDDFGDFIQTGIIGILEALKRFDVDLDCKFSSYAYYWIKNELIKEIRRNSVLKFSSKKHEKFLQISSVESEYMGKTAKQLDEAEILEKCDVKDEDLKYYRLYKTPVDSINRIVGDAEIGYLLPDDGQSVEKEVEDKILNEMLCGCLESELLTDEEKIVITNLYGIGTDKRLTKRALGELLHIKPKSISKIEATALSKLREEILKINIEERNVYKV